mgnify:CR=1 FL=1
MHMYHHVRTRLFFFFDFSATGDVELLQRILSVNSDIYLKTAPTQYYSFEVALKHQNRDVAKTLLHAGFHYSCDSNQRTDEQAKYCVRLDHLVLHAERDSKRTRFLRYACLAGNFWHNILFHLLFLQTTYEIGGLCGVMLSESIKYK